MEEPRELREWHPAIKALGWIAAWSNIAACTGVVCGVVAELFTTKRSDHFAHPLRTGLRGAAVVAVAAALVPVIFAGVFWWNLVKHARREYERTFATKLILIETAVIGLAVTLYSAAAFRLLRYLWQKLAPWSGSFDSEVFEPRRNLTWIATLLLIAGSIVVAVATVVLVYPAVRNYRACLRVLGARHVLRGIGLMTRLRFRQPRRDFFMQTPVISDMRMLVLAALAYVAVPSEAFAVPIAAMIVLIDLAITLDRIRPPTWLFLGASHFDSFAVFLAMRRACGVTAVTLLDRTSEEGRSFYDAERTYWSENTRASKWVPYDPTVPRVWSLRTRPHLWDYTVVQLIDYVPRVVVDMRLVSDYVRAEVEWLSDPERIDKAWFVAGDDGLTPELAAMIPASSHARVFTKEALIRTAAPESDPAPTPSPRGKSPTPAPP
jgi:hypothetical protein